MQSETPLFTDKSRLSFMQLVPPALALYMVLLGITQGNMLGFVLGLLLGLYVVATFHFRYELYRDAFVIRYLALRRMAVPLSDISDAYLVRVPLRGQTVVIRREKGGPLLIRPGDAEQFLVRLNEVRA